MMLKSVDCAGQGRCWSSLSCSSNYNWTVPTVWIGTLSSWKTASLFENNVWIMRCTWLPKMSANSPAVIRPRRVVMRPKEYQNIAVKTTTKPPTSFTFGTKHSGF
jgi:hypothetical protein